MRTGARLLLSLPLLAVAVLPGRAQQATILPGADPALAQPADPNLVKLVPAELAAKPVTVAVALGSPPDDFRSETGEMVGWEIDLMRAAVQSLGLRLDLRATTFDSLIPGLQAKRFDAALGELGVSVVREKVVDMIGTLLGNELFAAPADSTLSIHTLDDLCGLTVATTRGSREMVFAEGQQPKCAAAGKQPINPLAFNDGDGAAQAMMSRRADMFWLGSTAVGYFVAQTKGRAKIIGSYTDVSYIGVALPKGSALAAPMQAAIQHLIDVGTYGKIVAKWGLGEGAVKQAPLNPTNVEK